MFRALLYAYVLGGLTFIPLLIFAAIFVTIYTSVPVGDLDVSKKTRGRLEAENVEDEKDSENDAEVKVEVEKEALNDLPRTRKGWLTMRRTYEETAGDGSYVTLVRSFLDSRSKDPKRSRPKDMWYVVLKGTVLYLYEDEDMSDCEAAIELSGHQVVIYPEDLPDAELFAKRNAICLKPKSSKTMSSVTKKMKLKQENVDELMEGSTAKGKRREAQRETLLEEERQQDAAREQAMDPNTPWFIFVRSNVEMEDWYFSLIHASEHPAQTPMLQPLEAIFNPSDMNHLIATLDVQPDVIPMRWLNALLARIFFSQYRTQNLESYIIGRLMKKLAKVKRPAFLTEIAVTDVSVGNKAPMFSKPMLKELTKEGDASIEVHLQYKGEIRITVEATAVINLGARFKSYTVKLTLAAVLKELEGNLLIKVKRPPSNRIWYAFTTTPRMVLEVEPIVSDRQITWGMILGTIESKFKEIIQESVVMPNMDDIAFFDTENYEHRGGIWSDACRKAKEPPAVVDESQLSSSVPVLATTTSSESTSAAPPDGASVQSAPAPQVDVSVSASAPGLPERKNSISSDTSKTSRRRTWFSSTTQDEVASSSTPAIISSSPEIQETTVQHVEEERGRLFEQQQAKNRSSSEHLETDQPSTLSSETIVQAEEPFLPIHPNTSRRSVSQHSMKLQNDDESDSSNSRPKSSPTTPRRKSDAAEVARSPSPQSFFSTLKSKAGDKQALSNTAKEAMLKWGSKWGGFKKDTNNLAQQSSDEGISGSPPRTGTLSSAETNGNGTFKPSMHKPRASYAEVRAAVAERMGQRSSWYPQSAESSLEDSGLTSPETSSSTTRTRPLSQHSSTNPETSINDSPSSSSATAHLTAPAKLSTKKSFPSTGPVNAEDSSDPTVPQPQDATHPSEENDKPTPIHVQPVAKTMSIPGIHASHRGEVMSMGYVAPQQSPPPAAPSNGPVTEAMLKMDLQKVYRFLKPNANNQPFSGPVTDPLGSGALPQESELVPEDEQVDTEGSDERKDVPPPLSLLSPSHTSSKPTPPPLPPRSSPRPISFSTNRDNASGSSPPSTSVSDVLKNIVQKDERNRSQASNSSYNPFSPSGISTLTPSAPDSVDDDDVTEFSSSSTEGRESTPQPKSISMPQDLPVPNGTAPPLPPRRTQTSTS